VTTVRTAPVADLTPSLGLSTTVLLLVFIIRR
jgi:hypothetical protein